MKTKLFFVFATLFYLNLSFATNSAFDSDRKPTSLSLYGGWSKVSEDFGFGGHKSHAGLDVMFFVSKKWFLDVNLHSVDMGTSANTELNQSNLSIGLGYRCQALRVWAGLGIMTQAKDILSPNFYYVDPAPNTTSTTTVNDNLLSWSTMLAYDFVLTKPSSNFPWYFAIGPHLHLFDAFKNNGFDPVLSAGVSLSLL